ncbi:hypothetical protein CYMTET_42210 [Cymbomonas tetramitiformis]|uniref:Uncharacterized protein n=1 Tax=Cymbomonas tetramitiformis TaxID=36881 RepID=A0AAE0C6P8_9CHLO|nr:hypothetical protein CYMTET_42210 [Cymbomonas tetramitiformis]
MLHRLRKIAALIMSAGDVTTFVVFAVNTQAGLYRTLKNDSVDFTELGDAWDTITLMAVKATYGEDSSESVEWKNHLEARSDSFAFVGLVKEFRARALMPPPLLLLWLPLELYQWTAVRLDTARGASTPSPSKADAALSAQNSGATDRGGRATWRRRIRQAERNAQAAYLKGKQEVCPNHCPEALDPRPLLATEHRLVRENWALDWRPTEQTRKQQLFDRLDPEFYRAALDRYPMPSDLATDDFKMLANLVTRAMALAQVFPDAADCGPDAFAAAIECETALDGPAYGYEGSTDGGTYGIATIAPTPPVERDPWPRTIQCAPPHELAAIQVQLDAGFQVSAGAFTASQISVPSAAEQHVAQTARRPAMGCGVPPSGFGMPAIGAVAVLSLLCISFAELL